MDIAFLKGFNADFDRYYRRCVAFAKSYTYDTAQSECFAAEALAVLWEKESSGEHVREPLPFLFTVIRNKALKYLRHKYIREQADAEQEYSSMRDIRFRINSLEACDPSSLYEEDIQNIIENTLDSLGGRTKDVFCLSRFQGLSNQEIAERLGISEKTVEYHITRALKQLRLSLKDYLPLVAIFLNL